MSDLPSRERALSIVEEYTANENLRKHMYAVEAAMRAYARRYGESEERWGVTGLLHDFDYERWPNPDHHPTEGHPTAGSAILEERGVPEDVRRAILSHAEYTGVDPESRMELALRAVDELTGFIVACALVVAATTCVAEAVSRDGLDNLAVPFTAWAVLAALQV